MKFLPVKKLKIFKDFTASLPKTKRIPSKKETKSTLWQQVVQNPFTLIFLFVLILAYFISYVPSKSLPAIEEGEIAASDIIAPADNTIIDRETTEKRKQEAEEGVLPVYTLDKNVFLNTEEKIREFFNSGREWHKEASLTKENTEDFQTKILEIFGVELSSRDIISLARAKFGPELEEILISLINKTSARGIILSKNLFIHGEQEQGFTLTRGPESEKTTKVDEILDINEGEQRLTEEINKLDLSQRNKSFIISLSHSFLTPNIAYNKVETDARKSRARSRVETVFYTIKKGKVIVRKGDEVSSDAVKQIIIINQNLRAQPSWFINFLGTFLLYCLLFIALWSYLKSLLKLKLARQHFLMMGITLIAGLAVYKLSRFLGNTFSQSTSFFLSGHAESYWYAFPYQFGTLLFVFLTTNHLALIFTVMNSIIVGYLFQGNFSLMIYALIGGLAAIYGVNLYGKQRWGNTIRTGIFLIAPINILIIITFHLIREKFGSIGLLTSEVMMGLVGSVFGATVAFLFLPVFEYVFKFLTPTKLLELTNSDLPVFKQMAIEAPGSYHHSLVVASLAETAAEEVNLDSMLVKAGGLYHDVGKIIRPEYFIENQASNPSLHKDLTPSMSTLVIVNHVKEGVELARKLKLPRIIRDIIQQHHGNTLVRYFYQKAKEKYDPEMQKIEEERYRYPGPRPQTREAALVLLADSVEAASRSLKSPSKESLKKVINDIFENTLQDGQLDDCEFTLKELRIIASSFHSTLYSIYHHRVSYPGFDFELEKKKKNQKKQNSNDRNHKPSEKIQDKPEKS